MNRLKVETWSISRAPKQEMLALELDQKILISKMLILLEIVARDVLSLLLAHTTLCVKH